LFATAQHAADAIKELKASGYSDSQITVVHPGADTDATVKAIAAANVLTADAVRYAEHVKAGCTLVSVETEFGRGAEARLLMDHVGTVDPGFEEKGFELESGWDEATPLSSALRLPVLSKPKLRFLGLGELISHDWQMFSWLPSLTKGGPVLPGPLLTKGGPILPGNQLIKN
jgi:hypothetical protein